jgi:hypothetical protein
MLKILRLVILSLFFFCNANSEVLKIFEFTEEELKSLEVRKIKGETLWSVGSNQNGNYLKAEANAVASGLGKEINIDLNKTPYLNITWKVEKDLKGIIENSKKGHDYAARVFVIKKTGATALSNRALNYVFSSNNDIDQNWFSPYTKKSVDYILSTTKQHLNEWVTVKVNIKEHFKKFHNLDVDNLDGIALMTDTDNSELLAISYYQNIFFSSN